MRLRILLIDLFEGPGHAYYTGRLARALASAPELDVGVLVDEGQDPAHYGPDVELFPLRAPSGLRRFGPLLRQPVELARLGRVLTSFRPDLLHHVFFHPWFAGLAPFLDRRRPVLSTWHDITPHDGEDGLVTRLTRRAMLGESRRLFVHGPRSAEEAQRRWPALGSRIVQIPHGHFNELGGEPLRDPDEGIPAFLLFGRLGPYKGVPVALSAFERLSREGAKARLILAGEGSRAAWASSIRALGAMVEDHPRRLTDEELRALLARSLVVLAPYRHASASGVVATAAAHGRAVFASRLGGLADMVKDGVNGRLFEPGRARELAELISDAIRRPEELVAMGREARQFAAREWSWDRVVERTLVAYRDALED